MIRPPTLCLPVHFYFSLGVMIDLQRAAQEEALSMAQAAPGDQEPLIGKARWRSMGELHLGQSGAWSLCGWMYHQGTGYVVVAGQYSLPIEPASRATSGAWK
jgi:hypothetical protein